MNYRVSFILLVLVAVVGGYVVFFQLQNQEVEEQAPWFYDVGFDDINRIKIIYQGESQTFAKKGTGWVFEASGEPVDNNRWGGIPLLLTGPRSTRVLEEQVTNPADFGLEKPIATITVTVTGGREITVNLGNVTPDGSSSYAMVAGLPTLFTLPSDWGQVITALVTRPPIVTPTTTPETPEAGTETPVSGA